jgi:hypothetical protein
MCGISFGSAFKDKYALERAPLLFVAVSTVVFVYFTAGDFWHSSRVSSLGVNSFWFAVYSVVFFCTILVFNFMYVRTLIKKKRLEDKNVKPTDVNVFSVRENLCIIAIGVVFIGFELVVFSLVEGLTLLVVGALPQSYIQQTFILLLGALPASLGLITLSTATKTLQQRNDEVHEALLRVNRAITESEEDREGKFDAESDEWQKMVAEQKRIREKRQGQK